MSNIFFNAISGSPIKNGSSISFNYGKTNKYYFNNATSIFLNTEDINNKYQNRFDNNILLNFLSSDGFIPITPSVTPSNTTTPTVTPTQTLTPGLSPSASLTPTITPTNTNTPTNTLTNTNTPSSSTTPTPTNNSQTITGTPTPTPTNTNTPTYTATPTNTSTSIVSITTTPTSTSTITVTPTSSAPVLILTNSANFDNCAGSTSSVGTNGKSSYYGAYDMSGNVWEWNETTVTTSSRVFRGGNWGYDANYLSSQYRNYGSVTTRSEYIGFRVASYTQIAVYPNMVYVTDQNNTADSTGFGSLNYNYYIGKYEVTNTEYTEFLNSIAKTDTYSLYLNNMSFANSGGINRTGSIGNYIYSIKNNMGNKPVNFVNWANCARYCNWLSNGKPSGSQDASTTESGSYDMTLTTPIRNNNAIIFIPNENEWYKAAYYKGGSSNAGYWLFATQSNTAPNCVSLTNTGDGIPI